MRMSIKNRGLQLALAMIVAIAIASVASHVAVRWLRIKSTWGERQIYGPKTAKARTILHGSSLAYDGLNWEQVSEALGGAIETWPTAGSSPPEWEVLHRRSPQVTRSIVVVSPHDLNEFFMCDFGAEIVPLSQTFSDLRGSGADWQQSRRVLSQYPRMLIRKLFPTVGRSDGVMVGIRGKLQALIGRKSGTDEGEAPKFGGGGGGSETKEKVTDWTTARLQRRLALLRGACQGKYAFNGIKKLALMRLLQRSAEQGEAILIVMPVPPLYHNEFLTPAVMQQFETTLAEVQRTCPRTQVIRLDQTAALNNNELYSDTVHLNMYGEQIATGMLLGRLRAIASAH
jgi:hypothetical protein